MESKVLVVCHGNVCRSPLAHAVIVQQFPSALTRGFGPSGRRAAKKVREYAASAGYNLEAHRSLQIIQEDVDWADVILYMDGGNLKRLQKLAGSESKTVCLGSMIGLSRISDPNFLPRGPELERVLQQVIDASLEFCRQRKEKPTQV